jgi:hypothetical protein
MALAESGQAIGRVTALLRHRLCHATGIHTTVGRPEPPENGKVGNQGAARLNLFLYEAQFDPSLRNHPLDTGQQPPLWLVLRYLLTPFDTEGESDTMEALDQLGSGLAALQEMNFLRPLNAALRDNPEPLKLTFDEAPLDTLSKLMQGPDSRYRFSMAFQVRPVMVATEELPTYAFPVGVDQSGPAPVIIGQDGVRIPVLPSLGPVLTAVEPRAVEPGDVLVVRGTDLHLAGLSVRMGAATLPVVMQRPDVLQARVDAALLPPGPLRAGGQAVSVVQALPGGRVRSSNVLAAGVRPVVTGASVTGLHTTTDGTAAADVQLQGRLLGSDHDDVFVAFHRGGAVAALFDAPLAHAPDQATLTLSIPDKPGLPPGDYRVILRVNGEQARNSPVVGLTPP